jgi:hypothetical protein
MRSPDPAAVTVLLLTGHEPSPSGRILERIVPSRGRRGTGTPHFRKDRRRARADPDHVGGPPCVPGTPLTDGTHMSCDEEGTAVRNWNW